MHHVAILVTDTPIAGLTETFGDFGDNTADLLRECPIPTIKYQIAYEGTSQEKLEETRLTLANVAELIHTGTVCGVILTGSRSDSFAEKVPWITALDEFIRSTLYVTPNFPIVGLCFGHQILAKNLGCKVNRNTPENGWEAGTTTIALNKSILDVQDSPFRRALTTNDDTLMEHINLVEFHCDIVYGLPQTSSSGIPLLRSTTFQSIGNTAKCSIQGLVTEEGPVKLLTFQGHPEFSTPLALRILELDVEKGILDQATFEKLTYKTKNLVNQGDLIGQAISDFLVSHK